MNVNGKPCVTIWLHPHDESIVQIIDQRLLPHQFVIEDIRTLTEMAAAITEMHLRGAPLIGVAAAFGMYLASLELQSLDNVERLLEHAAAVLKASRPTAVNLAWAVDLQLAAVRRAESLDAVRRVLLETAQQLKADETERSRQIGLRGVSLIADISRQKPGVPVNVLTHCNAGWLGCIDYGTATAPIYEAFTRNIPVHVWVSETRPRNQGSFLTAWELDQHGVPHTVIADNTSGHLLQHQAVDLVLVGADRVSRRGDCANKIGTYLKALAAKDNGVAFYVALPSSTIDWSITDGLRDIPIEQRHSDEVRLISGLDERAERVTSVRLTPQNSQAANYGFDVTPARLISGFITEKGICPATEQGLQSLFAGR